MLNYQKSVEKSFVSTPVWCKNHTSVDRSHIQYKIYGDMIAIRCSADIVLEKKNQ